MILATGEIIIISKYNIHTYLGWKKEEGSFLLRIIPCELKCELLLMNILMTLLSHILDNDRMIVNWAESFLQEILTYVQICFHKWR